jgi:hypothetical protein
MAEGTFVVDLSVKEAKRSQEDASQGSVAIMAGCEGVIHYGSTVNLHEGNVSDLVTRVSHVTSEQDQVQLGRLIKVKIARAEHGLVRMDLTVQCNEVEKASKDGIVVKGDCIRTVQKVKLGNATKIVLSKDDHGAATIWIEVKVTDNKVTDIVPPTR